MGDINLKIVEEAPDDSPITGFVCAMNGTPAWETARTNALDSISVAFGTIDETVLAARYDEGWRCVPIEPRGAISRKDLVGAIKGLDHMALTALFLSQKVPFTRGGVVKKLTSVRAALTYMRGMITKTGIERPPYDIQLDAEI